MVAAPETQLPRPLTPPAARPDDPMEQDDISLEELYIEHCRYNELDDLRALVSHHGTHLLATARDGQGNSCLHMAAANGHAQLCDYLAKHIPVDQLAPLNPAGSSPIHWSIVNAQLEILRVLAPLVPDDVLLQPDGSGATPLDLAELNENAGECAGYIYGVLTIRERDRGREAGDHEGAEGLEEMMKETMLNTDGEREKTPTPAESPKRVVDEPER